MTTQNSNVPEHDLFGKMISMYTRADALTDGSLIDVTEIAKEVGIRYPVALSSAAWHGYVVPSKKDEMYGGQSVNGRLWDVLNIFAVFARIRGGNEILFSVVFLMDGKQKKVQFMAVCGPGDQGEPVITITLPSED